MQFSKVFFSAVLATTVAADAAPVITAMGKISTAIKGMNTALSSWTGDVVAASQILNQATDLLAVIDQAAKDTNAIQPLALSEAVKILQPGNALIADTKTIVASLDSKKADFDKNNLSSVVLDTLTKFKTGATGLITAIKSKLPANVASVGDSIGKQITSQLDTGITTFGGKA